jgi:tetratricopeptide (TPR) repeat protein
VQFAQGFHQEFFVPVEGTMTMVSPAVATRGYTRAVDFYRRASEAPELADESTLAIGYMHLRMKRGDLALEDLATPAVSPDPFVRYLAHLFRGRALEQLGRSSEAVDAYRAALDVIPHAQSAAIALAAARHVSDRADEAIDIMQASFAARPVEDPWREYGFGQFRHWPRYRDRMREALR